MLGRQPSSWSRLRGTLTPDEWLRLSTMFALIVALHLLGWGTLALVVEPAHLSVGDKAFGIGIGLTAYTLGLRHAFDADHIAAIDNTTRKLMNDGQRPLAVGFFFSLGHSSVVFGLAVLLAIGIKAIVGPVHEGSSALHHYASLIGTSVSGVFLYLIAIINLVILIGILRVFVRMRRGVYDDAELEEQLNNRG
ncbi:MAG: HoxN/HupN/NixA family nickel/cobalt transporter, partial [Mycobacterium sp.]|nr:HoxN/HupN/NixA family nickel/cobalt transporter [Mycobacterium sp.]